MFINEVMAAEATAASGGMLSSLIGLLPIVLIFVVFYFLLIRPQQKRTKAHKKLVENLKVGDRIVTAGGIVGTVSQIIDDETIMLRLQEGVNVYLLRRSVAQNHVNDAKKTAEQKKTDVKAQKAQKSQKSQKEISSVADVKVADVKTDVKVADVGTDVGTADVKVADASSVIDVTAGAGAEGDTNTTIDEPANETMDKGADDKSAKAIKTTKGRKKNTSRTA